MLYSGVERVFVSVFPGSLGGLAFAFVAYAHTWLLTWIYACILGDSNVDITTHSARTSMHGNPTAFLFTPLFTLASWKGRGE